jgi:tRNA 2-selenouridine synthase
VIVEAESSKIGQRMTPPALWRLMEAAPSIALDAPAPARARYLVATYREITEDPAALDEILSRVPDRPGRKRLAEWRALASAGEFEALAAALIELHYDPSYRRLGRKDARPRLASLELSGLGASDLAAAADRIAGLLIDAAARLPAAAVRA